MIDPLRNHICCNFSENGQSYEFTPFIEESDHEIEILIKVPWDKMLYQINSCLKKFIKIHKEKYNFFEPILTRDTEHGVMKINIRLKEKSTTSS